MMDDKPNFAYWERRELVRLCNSLWDDNVNIREANEQLRLDNKDLSRLLRECNTKETK